MSGMLDAVEPPSLAREELAQRWADVVNDPVLRNLPYRICIEVMSPSNLAGELKEKADLYLQAGAQETWILYPDLTIEIRDAKGGQQRSSLGVDIARVRAELGAL
jgi:hypothetical protein